MKLLITAGGTSEKIDDVRAITNHSTGKLGREIALAFLENPENEIVYLCSKNAMKPAHNACQIITIDSVAELLETLTKLLSQQTFDAVIHSMAVSDYRLDGALPEINLTEFLAESIVEQIQKNTADKITQTTFWQNILQDALTSEKLIDPTTSKISSDYDALYLKLVKTPKVIGEIKKLQPQTILVGFKLLVQTSKENLLMVAEKILQKNDCDFVLANDLSQIDDTQHIGYLLSANGEISNGQTKKELAQLIAEKVTQKFYSTHDKD